MQWCDKIPHSITMKHRALKDTSLEGRGGRGGRVSGRGERGTGAGDVPIYGQTHST